jgi:hypothetical protein
VCGRILTPHRPPYATCGPKVDGRKVSLRKECEIIRRLQFCLVRRRRSGAVNANAQSSWGGGWRIFVVLADSCILQVVTALAGRYLTIHALGCG